MATSNLTSWVGGITELAQQNSTAVLIGGSVLLLTFIALVLQRADSSKITSPALPGVFNAIKGTKQKSDTYTELFLERGVDDRKSAYADMTNHYYDLVTSFYEYGWGESFHFAARFGGETFRESIARHEYSLASKLGLAPGMRVVDVGCGVGGPARNIARFSGATVVGLNNNDFQCERGTLKARAEGLSELVSFKKGDFMHMPFPAASFDAAFAIEATCHAPDRVGVFSQVFNALKPGALFGSYEWVMTDKYDPSNATHNEIKRGIELGDSLPDLITKEECVRAFVKAGFEVVDVTDLAEPRYTPGCVPWYEPFLPNWNLENFKSRPLGLILSHTMVEVLEACRIAPRGSAKIHSHLWTATKTLRAGGELGIFTPMLRVIVRKPLGPSKGVAGAAPSKKDKRDASPTSPARRK